MNEIDVTFLRDRLRREEEQKEHWQKKYQELLMCSGTFVRNWDRFYDLDMTELRLLLRREGCDVSLWPKEGA